MTYAIDRMLTTPEGRIKLGALMHKTLHTRSQGPTCHEEGYHDAIRAAGVFKRCPLCHVPVEELGKGAPPQPEDMREAPTTTGRRRQTIE